MRFISGAPALDFSPSLIRISHREVGAIGRRSVMASRSQAREFDGYEDGIMALEEWRRWGPVSPFPSAVKQIIDDLKVLGLKLDSQIEFGGNGGKLQVEEEGKEQDVERLVKAKDGEEELMGEVELKIRVDLMQVMEVALMVQMVVESFPVVKLQVDQVVKESFLNSCVIKLKLFSIREAESTTQKQMIMGSDRPSPGSQKPTRDSNAEHQRIEFEEEARKLPLEPSQQMQKEKSVKSSQKEAEIVTANRYQVLGSMADD